MPPSMADIARICAATDKPVNVLVAGPFAKHSLAEFAQAGAARLSLGSALARVTHQAIFDAGRAMLESGDFTALSGAMPGADVDATLA